MGGGGGWINPLQTLSQGLVLTLCFTFEQFWRYVSCLTLTLTKSICLLWMRTFFYPNLGIWSTEKMITVDRRTQAKLHSLQFLWFLLNLMDAVLDCFLGFSWISVAILKFMSYVGDNFVWFLIRIPNLLFTGESDRNDNLSFLMEENIFQFRIARMNNGIIPLKKHLTFNVTQFNFI